MASYSLGNLQGGTIVEIDSLEGEKTGREIENTPGHALVMGPGGILWSVALGGCPRATDTNSLEQTRHEGCGGAFGLAVDGEGRPWIGSSTSRLDIDNDVWDVPVDANGNPFSIFGSGIAVDARGNAYTGPWTGVGGGLSAYRIDGETMEVTGLPGMGGHGWSVDRDGFVWSVDMEDSAHVMDPETMAVEDVRPPLVRPHAYSSNMTSPRNGIGLDPSGVYTHTFEICRQPDHVELYLLGWTAEVPEDSTVSFRLAFADSVDALAEAAWIDVAMVPPDSSPLGLGEVLAAEDVDLSDVRYVKIEATLLSVDRLSRPTLDSMSLAYSCQGL